MKKLIGLLLVIACHVSIFAQQIRPKSSTQIYQQLKQLNQLGAVMYLAAHPDDENTRLISYLVHHENVRTIYLSLTRGDGGQNIIGTEQGPALGLIRTYELLEARKIDGAEQAFTPAIDFGFSKSPEETFQFWDQAALVQNVVDAFQKFRPDVVICRFPTTGEGGHGQHTASAIVAEKAYRFIEEYNAKNPNHQLFLPKRLLFNAFKFGNRSTIKPGQFKIPINQFDPLLGEGYGEIAGRSRSIHKSQGAGTPQSVGVSMEHFELMAGTPMTKSLFDGVNRTWSRAGNETIEREIDQIIRSFRFDRPSESIQPLLEVRKSISRLENDHWRTQKLKEIDEIILSCAGIMIEVLAEQPQAVKTEELNLNVRLIQRGTAAVSVLGALSSDPVPLQSDSLYQWVQTLSLGNIQDLDYTQPYWLKSKPVGNAFRFPARYEGLPEAENPVAVPVQLLIGGQVFVVDAPVSYKYLHPTRGDIVQRIRIVPELSVEPVEQLFIYDKTKRNELSVKVRANTNMADLRLQLYFNGTKLKEHVIPGLKAGEVLSHTFTLEGEIHVQEGVENTFELKVVSDGRSFHQNQHLLAYEHIPELQYFTDAAVKVIEKNWRTAVKTIGYVEGVGDYVDDVLRLAGLDVQLISDKEIGDPESLRKFDAIVVGIRALNTRPILANAMQTLLQYCAEGGTLLLQYNTSFELVTDQLGPYPMTISRDRVTEEKAEVAFLDPKDRLLNWPNKLTKEDFDDWVQERGLYFPGEWDPRYHTLLSMHDRGEPPLKSAVLYADYGKGLFVYTSLAFFRQLPAGNRGAIRFLLNLMSGGEAVDTLKN